MKTKIDQMLDITLKVQESNSNLTVKLNSITDDLTNFKTECQGLKKENETLKTQVADLTSKLNKAVWESFHKDKNTLLMGDATLQAIDPKKLLKTQVVVNTSAKVEDVSKKIEENSDSYSKVIICVGTNDCVSESINHVEVADSYKSLIEKAKSKVCTPADVIISSVVPRSDSTATQGRVETLNDCLENLTKDAGVTFVNNDDVFKLKDGNICTAFFKDDGTSLTSQGTLQLAKKLKLKIKPGHDKSVCKQSDEHLLPKRQSGNGIHSSDRGENSADGWQYQRRARRYPNQNSPQNGGQKWSTFSTQDHQGTRATVGGRHTQPRECGFCGESNHREDRCRHGEPLQCYVCGGNGHKSKFHKSA